MVVSNSQQAAPARGGEELHTEFCSVFLFDFFPGVHMGGPRFVAGAKAGAFFAGECEFFSTQE